MATNAAVLSALATFQRHWPGQFILPDPKTSQGAMDLRLLAADWSRMLANFSDRLVAVALDEVLANYEKPPSVAALVKVCRRLAVPYYPTSGQAWGQVIHELRRGVPGWVAPVFTIDLVEKIVDAWSWQTFVSAYQSDRAADLSILQDRFGKEYDERVRREMEQLAQTGHEWDLAETYEALPAPQPEASPKRTDALAEHMDPPARTTGGEHRGVGAVPGTMDAIRAYIRTRPALNGLFEATAAEFGELYAQARAAHAAGDLTRWTEVQAEIRRRSSPAGYRAALAEWFDAIEPGLSEQVETLRTEKTCPDCGGQGYRQVPYKQVEEVVEVHWQEVSRNARGVVYRCPTCSSAAWKKQHAASQEARATA